METLTFQFLELLSKLDITALSFILAFGSLTLAGFALYVVLHAIQVKNKKE